MIQIIGLEKLERLKRDLEKVKQDIPKKVKEATEKGYQIVLKNAPYGEGRLQQAIYILTFPKEGWIVSSTPRGIDYLTKKTNVQPYHLWIELGTYPSVYKQVYGKVPRIRPAGAGRVGYMQKSAEEIERVFKDKINVLINQIV